MGSEVTDTKTDRSWGCRRSLDENTSQCVAVVKKANSVLGSIRTGIENKMANNVMCDSASAFGVLCTPHRLLCLKNNIAVLEKVQKRAICEEYLK